MNYLVKKRHWLLAGWIAFVFLQSLFFKFAGAPETRYIFGILGHWSGLAWFGEYGAWLVGIAELIASLLLFSPRWPWGALLALGIMSGAIFFHLFTPLGIFMPVFDESGMATDTTDGGLLFIMACMTWASALVLVLTDWLKPNGQLRRALPLGERRETNAKQERSDHTS